MRGLSRFEVPGGFRGGGVIKVQLWWAVQATLFCWSLQVIYRWRTSLLQMFGARIGKNVVIRPSARVTYPWKLTLGDYAWVDDDVVLHTLGDIMISAHAVISQRGYLCTGGHDHVSQHFDINTTPTVVGAKCWLATDVFIAPGVMVGDGTVVGARSSVFRSLPANVICWGNLAVVTHECVEKIAPWGDH